MPFFTLSFNAVSQVIDQLISDVINLDAGENAHAMLIDMNEALCIFLISDGGLIMLVARLFLLLAIVAEVHSLG